MLLQNSSPGTTQTDTEDGYLLLTVLVMVFLMLLALSVAAPKVAKEIQRDKEQEAVQRGQQYRRAIQLYYKKFGAYPSDIKQLEKTNEIRFLRKRYTDPITGKDDWRLIHMGEAKVPPMGFFGQPLQAGLSSVSTGPGLGTGSTPGLYAPGSEGDPSANGGANGAANGTASGAANGATNNPTNSGSSSFGFSNSGSNNGSSGTGSPGIGSTGSGFGFSNNNGTGTPGSGAVGTTPNGTNGQGASNNGNGGAFGNAGPIVGVGIPVKKDSMLEYHKQKKYADWEFVYDPQQDLLMNGSGIASGGNVNGADANGNPAGTGTGGASGSSSTPFGFNNGNSGGNSGSGFGNFGNSGSGSPPSSGPGSNMPSNPQQ